MTEAMQNYVGVTKNTGSELCTFDCSSNFKFSISILSEMLFGVKTDKKMKRELKKFVLIGLVRIQRQRFNRRRRRIIDQRMQISFHMTVPD